jgi:peroxiredoxin Q/BCP
MLDVGQAAPDFELERVGGGRFRLSQALKDSRVLLYFFPKNFTPL